MSDRAPLPQLRQAPGEAASALAYLLASIGMIASAYFSGLLYRAQAMSDVAYGLVGGLVYYLPFVLLPVLLIVFRREGGYEALRPNPVSLFSTIGIVLMALLTVFLANDIGLLWQALLQALGVNIGGGSLGVGTTPAQLTLAILSTAVLPGVCEELLFRGVLFSSWEKHGTRFAMVLSSLLFMLLHGSILGAPTQFLIGLMLAELVYSFDSIYAGMIFHTTYNAALVILQYVLSGAVTTEDIQAAELADTNMLAYLGGASGVLSMLLEILMMGALVFFSLKVYRRRARLNGIEPMPRVHQKLSGGAWALLISGVAVALLICGVDIFVRLPL